MLDYLMVEGLMQGWDEALKTLVFRIVLDMLIDTSGILRDSAISDDNAYNNLRILLSDDAFVKVLIAEYAVNGLVTQGIEEVVESALKWLENNREIFTE